MKIRPSFGGCSMKQTYRPPGAHDALTAKSSVKWALDAVYMTGYGQAASHLGCPDVGLMTFTEMGPRGPPSRRGRRRSGGSRRRSGFGNAVNVMRTVKEYEKAGVAVIQLEDQVMPKKCGHMVGRQVVPMEEMVGQNPSRR